MRDRKRHILTLFLLLMIMTLTACQQDAKSPAETTAAYMTETANVSEAKASTSLAEYTVLPENGIITADELSAIAGKKGVWHFTGETEEGISYDWAYDGSQIHNPQDQHLKLDFSADTKEIQQAANNAPYGLGITIQEMDLAAAPTLTLTLPERWQADRVLYCISQEGKLYQLSEASIQPVRGEGGKTYSQISLTVTKAGGTYYLLGGQSQAKASDSQAKTDGKKKSSDDASGKQNAASEDTDADEGDDSADEYDEDEDSDDDYSWDEYGDDDQNGSDIDRADDSDGSQNDEYADDDAEDETLTCTISISCQTILDHMDDLDPSKASFVPSNGIILPTTTVEFTDGDTVFDVLKAVCKAAKIHMESDYTPAYGTYYVSGINQLYEFDCGSTSGWLYQINGWQPNYGCSEYVVSDGDEIEWIYTCSLGSDVN